MSRGCLHGIPLRLAPTAILIDRFHTRGMVTPGTRCQPCPGDWVCTRCAYYNYAPQTQCHVCRAANTATMAPGDLLCPGCGNSNKSRRIHCNKCQIPRPAMLRSEYGSPRRVALAETAVDGNAAVAKTEQRVLPVPYTPAPRRSTPRHLVYCEEPERPQKRQKTACRCHMATCTGAC